MIRAVAVLSLLVLLVLVLYVPSAHPPERFLAQLRACLLYTSPSPRD